MCNEFIGSKERAVETQSKYNILGQRVAEIGPYDAIALDELTESEQADALVAVTTNYEYDHAGRLTAVILPPVANPTDPAQHVRTRYEYEYDQYGNTAVIRDNVVELLDGTRITDHDGQPGDDHRETHFTYDRGGRQLTRTLPIGVDTPTAGDYSEQMMYDELGRLQSSIDFEGHRVDYHYDELGRLERRNYFEPGITPSYTNDEATNDLEAVEYAFDEFGRPTEILQDRNADGDYDAFSDLRTTNTYNDLGQLIRVDSDSQAIDATASLGIVNYHYDPATGRLDSTWTGNYDFADYGNNAIWTRTDNAYDRLGRLTTVTPTRQNTNAYGAVECRYDAVGNLDQIERPNDVITDYNYDDLHRLVY